MAGIFQANRGAAALLAAGIGALAFGGHAHAADLTVDVDGFEVGKGHVMVALFTGAEGFPDKPAQGARLEANGKTVTALFKSLAPGRYAVSVYHDANDNMKLDGGMFGIPKERYGFSEDARGVGGPPAFRDAAFQVPATGAHITVHVK